MDCFGSLVNWKSEPRNDEMIERTVERKEEAGLPDLQDAGAGAGVSCWQIGLNEYIIPRSRA